SDEHVDVEIDRAACLLRAPRQSEGAAEGVLDAGVLQILVNGEHLLGEGTGVAAHTRRSRGSGGKRRRRECRAGNMAASSRAWRNSSPFACRSALVASGRHAT